MKPFDIFISNRENGAHGRQNVTYRVMNSLESQENDRIQINNINDENMVEHSKQLRYT